VIVETPTKAFRNWLNEIDRAARQDADDEQPRLTLLPILLRERAWQGEASGLD
jgi:hypothetical protein